MATGTSLARSLPGFVGVALAGALAVACTTDVQLRPRNTEWSTGGGDATWRSGDVEVVVSLGTTARAFPAKGVLTNHGPAPVTVSFVPRVSRPDSESGEIDRPAADGGGTTPISEGTPYEVPPLRELAPGRLVFALRPDDQWGWSPAVGSGITWSLVLATPSGEVRCPFEFKVASARTDVSTVGWIVLAILAAAALAAAFSHSASDTSDDLEDYPMGN